MENNFQFLIYRSAEEDVSINAVVKDESIWLTQQGMAELFGVQKPAISKHLKNIFEEGELDEKVVVSKMETTTNKKSQEAYLPFSSCSIILLYCAAWSATASLVYGFARCPCVRCQLPFAS